MTDSYVQEHRPCLDYFIAGNIAYDDHIKKKQSKMPNAKVMISSQDILMQDKDRIDRSLLFRGTVLLSFACRLHWNGFWLAGQD